MGNYRKKLNVARAVFVALLVAFLINTSCSNLFDPVISDSPKPGSASSSGAGTDGTTVTFTGSFSLSRDFSGGVAVPSEYAALYKNTQIARNAKPNLPSSGVTYTVSAETVGTSPVKTSSGIVNDSANTFTIPLVTGYKWKITVSALSGGNTILSDTYTMQSALSPDNLNISHTFILKPLASGTGSVSLYFTAPADSTLYDSKEISAVSCSNPDGAEKSTWQAGLSAGSGNIVLTDVPAGNYFVTIDFQKNNALVFSTTQAIIVYPRLTTNTWVSGGGSLDPINDSGQFQVTAALVNLFKRTQIFVGKPSDGSAGSDSSGDGSAANPYATVGKALERISQTGSGSVDYTIRISGTVAENVVISSTGSDAITTSNARSITLLGQRGLSSGIPQDVLNGDADNDGTGDGSVLTISTTVPITIRNLKITGGNATTNNDNRGQGGGIDVFMDGANITLDRGTLITGNTAKIQGGGVYFYGANNKLIMNEGSKISANNLIDSNLTDNKSSYGGAGVYFGCDYTQTTEANRPTFTMNGGEISEHKSDSSSQACGIGLRLCGSKFVMTGGKITKNTGYLYGGNIFAEGAKIEIKGGEISYGSLGDENHSSIAHANGGAISLNKPNGCILAMTLEMTGGKIINNSVFPSAGYAGNGAAAIIFENTEMTITGGEISGNCINTKHGNVQLQGGAFHVLGSLKIGGDAYIPGGVNESGSFVAGQNDILGYITVISKLNKPAPVATILLNSMPEDTQIVKKGSVNGTQISDADFAAACGKIALNYDGYVIDSDGKLIPGVSPSAAASAITSMTATGTVTIAGEMTSDQLASIKSALTTLKSTSSTTKVTLDLSGVTGIDTIPSEAFKNCSNLESIVLPECVTSIGGSAFNGCSNLESVVLPDSITSIGGQSFYLCSKLSSITLPQNLETIGGSAFLGCAFTEIEIPSSVTSIGSTAFAQCKFTSVTIPASVTTIDYGVFSQCNSLASLTVEAGNSNYVAEDNVLYTKNRNKIVAVAAEKTGDFTVPGSVTAIESHAFSGSKLSSITIPENVETIGSDAFMRCNNITSIEIPSSLTVLNSYLFEECKSLASVSFPDTLTELKGSIFQNCYGLTSIEIPASVTSIGYAAFNGCIHLKTVILNHSDATLTVAESAFKDCNELSTVYYMGTEEQRNSRTITIGSTGNNALPSSDNWDYSFVRVNGGTVSGPVGSGDTASNVFIDKRTVPISNLYVSDHEVTQAEYQNVMGTNPSKFKGDSYPPASGETQENRPVEQVSWYDAIVYCNKRSIDEGFMPCYSIGGSTDPAVWGTVPTTSNDTWNAVSCNFNANGYRLPTEAEWEYIARGGNNGIPSTQYIYSGSDTEDSVAWCTTNNVGGTHEVKKKNPNTIGIFDMCGNVWEWCWDKTDLNQDGTPIAITTSTSSTGATSGEKCIARGGAYSTAVNRCAVAFRHSEAPYNNNEYVGFRVVRNAQ